MKYKEEWIDDIQCTIEEYFQQAGVEILNIQVIYCSIYKTNVKGADVSITLKNNQKITSFILYGKPFESVIWYYKEHLSMESYPSFLYVILKIISNNHKKYYS